jgi:hypothetical protein
LSLHPTLQTPTSIAKTAMATYLAVVFMTFL